MNDIEDKKQVTLEKALLNWDIFKKNKLPKVVEKCQNKLNSKSPIYLFHYEDDPVQILVFNFNFLDESAILEYKTKLEETIHDISENFKKSNYQDSILIDIAPKLIYELYERLVFIGEIYVVTKKNKKLTRGIDHIRYDKIKRCFLDYGRSPFPKGIEVIIEKINLSEEE